MRDLKIPYRTMLRLIFVHKFCNNKTYFFNFIFVSFFSRSSTFCKAIFLGLVHVSPPGGYGCTRKFLIGSKRFTLVARLELTKKTFPLTFFLFLTIFWLLPGNIRTTDFRFIETSYGGSFLVFGGFTYRKKSTTNRKSYWFCTRKKCPSRGILNQDGSFQTTNVMHNHTINEENVKRKEKLAQLRKLAIETDHSGQTLLEALGIKENVEKHLSFIRTVRSRAKKSTPKVIEPLINVGLDYKKISSRNKTAEMIYYDGYTYRQDSSNKSGKAKDKSKYWRCKEKFCKARAKTDEKENFIIVRSIHSHPRDTTEESCEELKEKLQLEVLNTEKSAKVIISEYGINNPNLKRYVTNLKKSSETTEMFENVVQLDAVMDPNNQPVDLVLGDADGDTFSIENLMASSLEDNYGVTSFDL